MNKPLHVSVSHSFENRGAARAVLYCFLPFGLTLFFNLGVIALSVALQLAEDHLDLVDQSALEAITLLFGAIQAVPEWVFTTVELVMYLTFMIAVGNWASRAYADFQKWGIKRKYTNQWTLLFMMVIPLANWFIPNLVFEQLRKGYVYINSKLGTTDALPAHFKFNFNWLFLPYLFIGTILRQKVKSTNFETEDASIILESSLTILTIIVLYYVLLLLVFFYIWRLVDVEQFLSVKLRERLLAEQLVAQTARVPEADSATDNR